MRQPSTFGKYLLLDRISVGGMAEVFKAKTFGVEGFAKIVALKRILPSMGEDEDFIRMFVDEAKIAGQLSHANICQIFELGREADIHYIAMEYIWGKDLLQIQNRLRRIGETMAAPLACHLVAKVCEGLHYAHKKRDQLGQPLAIVHRDCSPQNILVSYQGEVKLIDFGIAKAASRSSRTNGGVLKGKFGYMSPEQVRGLPLDRRSDVFALGTILYETLTGTRLFLGESDFSTLEKVRNADVAPPTEHNADIPAEVEQIVLRALRRNPADRYQWASEMHDDLRAFLTKQENAVTAKSLGDLLRRLFSTEHDRELALLDRYQRIGPDGRLESALPTGTPPPEDPEPAPAAPLLAGGRAPAGEFEERPTEVFGEISEHLGALAEVAEPAESGEPTVVGSVADDGTVVVGTDPALALSEGREPTPPPYGARPVPAYVPAESAPGLPHDPYSMPLSGATGRVRMPTASRQHDLPAPGQRRRGRSVATDIGVGLGIAAVVLVLFVLGRRFLFSSDDGAAASAPPPSATLAVVVSDELPAEVFLGGERAGRIAGGAPLTLEGIAPGAYQLEVRREGAEPCAREVTLAADAVEVVTCRFADQVTNGELVLAGLGPAHRVLLDGQEMSRAAAGQPISLEAGRAHQLEIRAGDQVVERFEVSLEPGERLRHQLALAPAETDAEEKRAARDRSTDDDKEKEAEDERQTERQRPERERPSPPPEERAAERPAKKTGPGFFTAYTRPWARVFIDGRDTGKMTPIAPAAKIELSPGKHRVTFVVGDERFDYSVTIRPGETTRLARSLPVSE